MAVALPARPPGGADALSRRDFWEVLLPEGCARLRAGLDPHGADGDGRGARHRPLRLRRRGDAPLRREPGNHPAARVRGEGPSAVPTWLAADGPGSERAHIRVA